jgi:hypothetical protein
LLFLSIARSCVWFTPCFRFPFQVPIPDNEAERLFTLRASELLDSDRSDPMFDRFTALAQRLFNVPIVLVSLVDERRQWCDHTHSPACRDRNDMSP